MITDFNNMQQPKNQSIEFFTNESRSLPNTFGKCLGLESIDPQTIHIRTPKRTPVKEPAEAKILNYAATHLPLSGKLKMDDRGFIYLDLPDAYIYELVPFLDTPGVAAPPYFDTLYKAGAHITVALTSENHLPLTPALFEEQIPFTLTGCYFVEPENWLEMETIWFITVDAPRLSEIRTEMGLSPKVQGHEFHITFAVKKRFLSIHDLLIQSPENQSIIIKNI